MVRVAEVRADGSRKLTVAGQQMRTSYLRPSSRWESRYHESRPWGAGAEGKLTARGVDRTGSAAERDCRRRASKLGRT